MAEESKGQAEMKETGEKLDESQQNQLDDFMDFIESPAEEKEEELEAAKQLEKDLADEKQTEEEEKHVEEEDEKDAEEEDESSEEDAEGEEYEEEAEDAPSDELIDLKAQLEEQKKLLERFQEEQTVVEEEKKIKIEIDPNTLITEEEAQEYISDPHKVLKTLAERIYVKAREDTLKDIPQLVESGARRQTALAEARSRFWTDNSDLLEKAKSVPAVDRLIRMTANELQAENPAWTVERIFAETGKQVRGAISLSKKAQQIEEDATKGKKKKGSNQPTKPRGKRKSPPKGEADQRSGLQKDLDAMVESIE